MFAGLRPSKVGLDVPPLAGVRAGRKLRLPFGLPFSYNVFMSKAITVKQKKRGRPATGTDPLVGIRLTPAMIAALDEIALEWRTTRSSVMRQLMEHALASPPKPKKALAARTKKPAER